MRKGGEKKTDRKDIMHALIHPSTHTFPFQGWGGGSWSLAYHRHMTHHGQVASLFIID